MLIVIGLAEAEAGDPADIRWARAEMMRKTREEPGCLSSSLAIGHEGDLFVPAVISVAERWDPIESLKAHPARST